MSGDCQHFFYSSFLSKTFSGVVKMGAAVAPCFAVMLNIGEKLSIFKGITGTPLMLRKHERKLPRMDGASLLPVSGTPLLSCSMLHDKTG